jgi:hypothetical protein
MERTPMRREISTKIEIETDARSAWYILVDFPRYPEWNPFIPWVRGTPTAGGHIRFVFQLLRGISIPACARVLKVEPKRELRWAGGIRGLLRAEHYMLLEPLTESRVRLRHGEIFTGLLVPLAWRLVLARHGPPAYENTNTALKQRAEKA